MGRPSGMSRTGCWGDDEVVRRQVAAAARSSSRRERAQGLGRVAPRRGHAQGRGLTSWPPGWASSAHGGDGARGALLPGLLLQRGGWGDSARPAPAEPRPSALPVSPPPRKRQTEQMQQRPWASARVPGAGSPLAPPPPVSGPTSGCPPTSLASSRLSNPAPCLHGDTASPSFLGWSGCLTG